MNKLSYELELGAFNATTFRYKRQEKESFLMLEKFFNLVENPYLALSWGKQSICIAHMIWQIRPITPMVFTRSWESYLIHNFEEVIQEFRNTYVINYIDNYCDNVSWNSLTWKETRDLGQKDIQNMGQCIPNWDGVIMGLSKEESKGRRITTSLKTTDIEGIFRYVDGRYRCTPVQNWNNNDIASYVHLNKLPLLQEYHKFGLSARTTARITRMFIDNNGLFNLKIRDMGAYNQIIKRFPCLQSK